MRGRTNLFRLVKDEHSGTGYSVAILLRDVRPRKSGADRWKVVSREFSGDFKLNCDGVYVSPRVKVSVYAEHTEQVKSKLKHKRELDAAIKMAPILK